MRAIIFLATALLAAGLAAACSSHDHCAADEYCKLDQDAFGAVTFCDSCTNCDSGHALGSNCPPKCASQSCASHDDCVIGEYCNDAYTCYDCNYCFDAEDAFDNSCPSCFEPPSPPPPPPPPPPPSTVSANLVLKCGRGLDLTTITAWKLSVMQSRFEKALSEDCNLTPSEIVSDFSAITVADSNSLSIPFVSEAARDSVQSCIENKRLRFARCNAVSALPATTCSDTSYTTTAEFVMRGVSDNRQIDQLDAGQLNTLAARLRESIQTDCGLDACDVNSSSGSDITPVDRTRFYVPVKDASTIENLDYCGAKLRFYSMRVGSVTEFSP